MSTTATPIGNDSSQPMHIAVQLQGLQAAGWIFWARRPDEDDWTKLQDGNTGDGNPDEFDAGPFPAGTLIRGRILIAGRASAPYQTAITYSQRGATVAGGQRTAAGTTSASGTAVEIDTVQLS
jgi:hypothetical protein